MSVQRLRPQLPPPPRTYKGEDMREALRKHIKQKMAGDFQRGFAAGQAARQGHHRLPSPTSHRNRLIPACASSTRMRLIHPAQAACRRQWRVWAGRVAIAGQTGSRIGRKPSSVWCARFRYWA